MAGDTVTVRQLATLQPQQMARVLAGPPELAAKWIAAAAHNGIVEAQVVYGHLLLCGKGVAVDASAAFFWFKQAAQADHPLAMNMAGRCYELGWGTKPHFEVAAYWYRLAARSGLDWGMYNYATALALGRGVAIDREEALLWFERAAVLGHAKSHNYIGSFYEDGWGVEANYGQARHHYRLAAEGGDFRGQYNYARLLMEEGEMTQATFWLNKMREHATPEFLEKAYHALLAANRPAMARIVFSAIHVPEEGSARPTAQKNTDREMQRSTVC